MWRARPVPTLLTVQVLAAWRARNSDDSAVTAMASSAPSHPSVPPPTGGEGEPQEESVVLPLFAILVAIAVPFSLAVASGVGGSIALAAVAILAAAVCLAFLMVALLRLMGDSH